MIRTRIAAAARAAVLAVVGAAAALGLAIGTTTAVAKTAETSRYLSPSSSDRGPPATTR